VATEQQIKKALEELDLALYHNNAAATLYQRARVRLEDIGSATSTRKNKWNSKVTAAKLVANRVAKLKK